jgi:hypothetical protein
MKKQKDIALVFKYALEVAVAGSGMCHVAGA